MTFDEAFAHVVGVEGRYSDNLLDRGGPTMYGITVATARANGYTGEMRCMPLATAKFIYRRQYWDLMKLDDINVCNSAIAVELFDTGVNTGIGTAGRFLQRCLNALNRHAKDYADLVVDGIIGPTTVSALRQLLAIRGDNGVTVLLRALNSLQGSRYIELAEGDASQEEFIFGWLLNRVVA